jgi:hypothetical protein
MSILSSSIVTVHQNYCVSDIGCTFVFRCTGFRKKVSSVGFLSRSVLRLWTQQNMLSVSFCRGISADMGIFQNIPVVMNCDNGQSVKYHSSCLFPLLFCIAEHLPYFCKMYVREHVKLKCLTRVWFG